AALEELAPFAGLTADGGGTRARIDTRDQQAPAAPLTQQDQGRADSVLAPCDDDDGVGLLRFRLRRVRRAYRKGDEAAGKTDNHEAQQRKNEPHHQQYPECSPMAQAPDAYARSGFVPTYGPMSTHRFNARTPDAA